MSPEVVTAILLSVIAASTPLLLAAIGELIVERSGVLNLGVEGMMIMGAVCGFAGAQTTGSAYVGLLVGVVAAMALALLFAILTIYLATNQVATGLSITLLGLGLSGLIGQSYVGQPGLQLERIHIPALSDIPVIGPLIFGHDVLVYVSIALTVAASWFLYRTRAGLVLRAVGDSDSSAHSIGFSVLQVRLMAVLFGGACAGLGGAYLSLVYTKQWVEGMTAGRGWIALALVVFASWRPAWALVGAYFFGAVLMLQFHLQAIGVAVPSQLLTALPYISTIVALVIISRNQRLVQANTPRCLGRPFVPDG